jgi:hypothetical protein
MGVTDIMCGPYVMRSRVGTHGSGAQYPREALFKGRNIQEFSVGDTSVRDTSTLHLILPLIEIKNCLTWSTVSPSIESKACLGGKTEMGNARL